MCVVGTLNAMVTMGNLGSTVWTSGPWCDGRVVGSRTTASMGPFFTSSGSVARLARTALALETPTARSMAFSVRQRPVVLQETTRTICFPFASSKLHWATKDVPVSSCSSPPWKMALTPACW